MSSCDRLGILAPRLTQSSKEPTENNSDSCPPGCREKNSLLTHPKEAPRDPISHRVFALREPRRRRNAIRTGRIWIFNRSRRANANLVERIAKLTRRTRCHSNGMASNFRIAEKIGIVFEACVAKACIVCRIITRIRTAIGCCRSKSVKTK